MFSTAVTQSQVWDRIDERSALRTLNAFAVDLISFPSAEDLLWYVAQNVVGRLNFVDCVIYQVDEGSSVLRQVAAWGEKNPFARNIINPLIIPFGQGITGCVAQSREPMIVGDLFKDRNYIPDLRPARSEICVPLIHRGRVVGVIDSEHPEPNAFGEAELEILTTVAAMTAAKLALLEEAQRSVRRYRDLVAAHARLTEEIDVRKALEASLHQARQLESIGRLTGRFSHEFNNILTVICGNLEFLEAEIASPETRVFLDEATAAAKRATKLLQEMLVFAEKTRLQPELFDLGAMVTEFCMTHRNGLTRDVDGTYLEETWPVLADRRAVECILRNLVTNAREATAAGGAIRIRIENCLYAWTQDPRPETDLPHGRYVRLSVSDTGAGIPNDRLSRIFDPFFTTKPAATARGLGLSVVRGLARQSGGSVAVLSELGRGSTFSVVLPALRDESQQPSPESR
jgi:signal transduction histidine kinase